MTVSRVVTFLFALLVIVSTAGCAVVAGIFKAGVWVGVVLAVLILAVVLFLFSRLAR